MNYYSQEIRQALARGYCDNPNHSKVIDVVLLESMAKEVDKIVDKIISVMKYPRDHLDL